MDILAGRGVCKVVRSADRGLRRQERSGAILKLCHINPHRFPTLRYTGPTAVPINVTTVRPVTSKDITDDEFLSVFIGLRAS